MLAASHDPAVLLGLTAGDLAAIGIGLATCAVMGIITHLQIQAAARSEERLQDERRSLFI
jgi:hypothetical protein